MNQVRKILNLSDWIFSPVNQNFTRLTFRRRSSSSLKFNFFILTVRKVNLFSDIFEIHDIYVLLKKDVLILKICKILI